jgi:uncharacterized protein YecE (DUF72 family)
MGQLFAGTSGWAYATWKPGFYPPKLASAKFLSHYSNRLNSVELNYTFRTFPKEKLLENWIDATPDSFKFSVKAHQSITHIKRLRDAASKATDFIATLAQFENTGRLGPILFQLPPNLKCDLVLLKDFLEGIPRRPRYAFEFRHTSWFQDDVYSALRDKNVALCQAESEDLQTPDVQTADFIYMRLRKETYSPKSRKALAAKVEQSIKSADAFIYFKHEDDPAGAIYAEELLKDVKGK